jgi:hypothetical protein
LTFTRFIGHYLLFFSLTIEHTDLPATSPEAQGRASHPLLESALKIKDF